MGAIPAVATKKAIKNTVSARPQSRLQSVVEGIPISQTETPQEPLYLQRKCSCGGGCPSCSATDESIQAKLKIGAANDKYEQEADRVADQVMQMPDTSPISNGEKTNSRKPLNITPIAQRQEVEEADDENEEDEFLRAKKIDDQRSEFTDDLSAYTGSLDVKGQPLPGIQREFFESRMQHDFSDVRIHTDVEAANSAKDINAKAYTVGNNVVFGHGQYSPGSHEGKKLLAHELAHTIQQKVEQPLVQRNPLENTLESEGLSSVNYKNDWESKLKMEYLLDFRWEEGRESEIQTGRIIYHTREMDVVMPDGGKVNINIFGTNVYFPTGNSSDNVVEAMLEEEGDAAYAITVMGNWPDGRTVFYRETLDGGPMTLDEIFSRGPSPVRFGYDDEMQYWQIVDFVNTLPKETSVKKETLESEAQETFETEREAEAIPEKVSISSPTSFESLNTDEKREKAWQKLWEEYNFFNVFSMLVVPGLLMAGAIAAVFFASPWLAATVIVSGVLAAIYGVFMILYEGIHKVIDAISRGEYLEAILQASKYIGLLVGIVAGTILLGMAMVAVITGAVFTAPAWLVGLAIGGFVVAILAGIGLMFTNVEQAVESKTPQEFDQNVNEGAREAEEATANMIITIGGAVTEGMVRLIPKTPGETAPLIEMHPKPTTANPVGGGVPKPVAVESRQPIRESVEFPAARNKELTPKIETETKPASEWRAEVKESEFQVKEAAEKMQEQEAAGTDIETGMKLEVEAEAGTGPGEAPGSIPEAPLQEITSEGSAPVGDTKIPVIIKDANSRFFFKNREVIQGEFGIWRYKGTNAIIRQLNPKYYEFSDGHWRRRADSPELPSKKVDEGPAKPLSEESQIRLAGTEIEKIHIDLWEARLLGEDPAWVVIRNADFRSRLPWLKQLFRSGGPDMVAINSVLKRILVGDVTSRFNAEHAGRVKEYTDIVAEGLPEGLNDHRVSGQEKYWEYIDPDAVPEEVRIDFEEMDLGEHIDPDTFSLEEDILGGYSDEYTPVTRNEGSD